MRPWAFAFILGAFGAFALSLSVADAEPVGAEDRDPAAASPASGAAVQWVILRVDGPNDGELLEGRSIVPLRIWTNCAEEAVVAVYVAGRFAQVRELSPTSDGDGQGVQIEVDLAAHGVDPTELADEDGRLELTFHLLRASDGSLVTHTRWSVRVFHPWIEFFVPLRSSDTSDTGTSSPQDDSAPVRGETFGEGDYGAAVVLDLEAKSPQDPLIPEGTVALQPHAPPVEQYFAVLTSDRRDVLAVPPEDPRSMLGSFPLAGGFVGRSIGDEAALPPVTLPPPSSRSRYIVLWTYSQRSGWVRSPIYRHAD